MAKPINMSVSEIHGNDYAVCSGEYSSYAEAVEYARGVVESRRAQGFGRGEYEVRDSSVEHGVRVIGTV